MVHLAPVRRGSNAIESLHRRVNSIKLEKEDDDGFYSSVYGTRYAAEALPANEMPEKEMPREVAYRMIKDELSLDGNPMLKYVFFTPLIFYFYFYFIFLEADCMHSSGACMLT